MDSDLKKDIKKILVIDSVLETACKITKVLDEVECELEEIFGKSKKCKCDFEEWFKLKNFK